MNRGEEILQLEEENRRAEMASDVTALSRHWTEQYFVTNPAGRVFEKSAILAQLQPDAPKPSLETYAKENMRVNVYGDSAVASFRVLARGRFGETPFEHQFRVTNVWVKSDGRWQMAATHTGTIAPEK